MARWDKELDPIASVALAEHETLTKGVHGLPANPTDGQAVVYDQASGGWKPQGVINSNQIGVAGGVAAQDDTVSALAKKSSRGPVMQDLLDQGIYWAAHRGAGRTVGRDDYLSGMDIGMSYYPTMLVDGGDFWQLADGTLVAMHDNDASSTTTGTGAITGLTRQEFKKLVAKTTGFVTGPATPQGRLENIPGPAVENPPTIDEILSRYKSKAVLTLELKGPLNTTVMQQLIDKVKQYGMEDAVSISAFDLPSASLVAASGIRAAISANAETDFTVQQVIDSGVQEYGARFMSATWDDAYLEQLAAAGIGVFPWYSVRRSVHDLWRARPGVVATLSDDPVYSARLNVPLLTDHYAGGFYLPGMVQADNFTRAWLTNGRLLFDSSTGGQWMLQGHMVNESVVPTKLAFSITFDAIGSNTNRSAGVLCYCPDDANAFYTQTSTSVPSGAYVFGFKPTGEIWFERLQGSTFTNIGPGAVGEPAAPFLTPAPTAGVAVPFTIERVGNGFKVTRVDTGHTFTTLDDLTYRGPYFHFGKSDGVTGMNVSFSAVTVTP